MRVALATGVLLLLIPATGAAALDVVLGPYVEAQRAGAVGRVAGRAYEETRQPREPDRPLGGASILVVPRSAELLATLEQIRARSRASAKAWTAATPEILRVKNAFELTLWEAGAAELARATAGDEEGRFEVADLPVGAWVLVATRSVRHEVRKAKLGPREQTGFLPTPQLTSFQAVMVWVRELTVGRSETVTVELTDRNVWFSGVVEEREPGAGP